MFLCRELRVVFKAKRSPVYSFRRRRWRLVWAHVVPYPISFNHVCVICGVGRQNLPASFLIFWILRENTGRHVSVVRMSCLVNMSVIALCVCVYNGNFWGHSLHSRECRISLQPSTDPFLTLDIMMQQKLLSFEWYCEIVYCTWTSLVAYRYGKDEVSNWSMRLKYAFLYFIIFSRHLFLSRRTF